MHAFRFHVGFQLMYFLLHSMGKSVEKKMAQKKAQQKNCRAHDLRAWSADQLQRAVEVNEYCEAAHLLAAVQQLSQHFQSFVSIPKVAELSGRLATLQRALQARSRKGPRGLDTGFDSIQIRIYHG